MKKNHSYLFLIIALLASITTFAQVGNVLTAMEDNTDYVRKIISIIKTWTFWVIGISFIIYAGSTVLGGNEGGDKTKKIGTYFMYLGFVGLAIVIVSSMFGI